MIRRFIVCGMSGRWTGANGVQYKQGIGESNIVCDNLGWTKGAKQAKGHGLPTSRDTDGLLSAGYVPG